MERLFEQLERYGESDTYPCHMPGHKRQSMGALPKQLAKLDITEIEGFDNLHQPQGILCKLQQYAAQVYGAEETFYLVNGSTCGILSAISAAVPMGGRLLIARNCHKSVYHGAYLRRLRLSYLYPALVPEAGICEAISPQQVQEALEREPDINGVLIVSPTYEGRIAEVEEIARIVHSHGIPLIVDEAHGAHLGFHPAFAKGSSRAGADLVVASVHKTLPAMTQTALLHVNGSLVDRRLVRRFLQIY
ncbi:MAG: aminotransferase class I/II-fold pyridoxal phosphate-dependent enzyme, partial [Acetatifactor sp.]|nr:aminotransferase class I/II-fold pyridoxal phosphate-dependent enzyme [Acetatifactor sp.]